MHDQTTDKEQTDVLAWLALIAALVVTAYSEYSLARAVGFNEWVAAGVPAALDIYAVRALRKHQDVLAVVLAMILVNSASHLYGQELDWVRTPMVIAVSAIAPLVLWRVHELRGVHPTPPGAPAPVEKPQVTPSAPAPEYTSAPVLERVPEQVHSPHLALVPKAAQEAAPAPEGAPEYVPEEWVHSAAEEDRAPAKAHPDDDELVAQVRAECGHRKPSLRELKDKYKIGQERARRVQAALAG